MKKIISLVLLILITSTASAQEVITEFDEKSVPVLNEELRKINAVQYWDKIDASTYELKDPLDIDFKGKQAISMVIENRTSDPASPVVGQIWIRTDI